MHWSEKYLGIPWFTSGREIVVGLDCWGLLRHIYKTEFGIELSLHPAPLGHLAAQDLVEKMELAGGKWHEVEIPTDGDAVALGKDGTFSHVGVYVDTHEPCMIHTARKELSSLIPIKRLREQGWTYIKFYQYDARSRD